MYHHFINSQYQTHTPLHEKHHNKAIISKSLSSFSIFQHCSSSPCFFLKAPVIQLSHYPSANHILHCCMILDFHHCESEATLWNLSLRPGEASTSFKRFCTCCANTIIACATFTLICATWMKLHRSSQPPAFLSALCHPITYCRLALSLRELFTLQAPLVQRRTACLLLYYQTD